MKKIKSLLSILPVVLVACSSSHIGFTVKNESQSNINDYAVVVSRQVVEKKLNAPLDNKVVLAQLTNKDTITTQFDDLDGDGKWDEMVMLLSFKAGESVVASIKPIEPNQLPAFKQRTNYRFGSKKAPYGEIKDDKRLKSNDSPTISEIYQMEGPAWENDLVGFRNYYDARNGIDIFGKKTTNMALDSAGILKQNYHEMDTWGMDILKVANSLGAGAIAIGIGDSTYRVGPCDEGDVKLITEGPIRTIIEFNFKGVPADSMKYDVRHQISINAGDHFYSSKVWLLNATGNEKIVTGIVNKHKCPLITDQSEKYQIFATHGAQAYKSEILGMGLLAAKESFISNRTSPMTGAGITETYLVELKANSEKPCEYHYFSGWEYQDSQFANKDYLVNKLKEAADKLSAKVSVH